MDFQQLLRETHSLTGAALVPENGLTQMDLNCYVLPAVKDGATALDLVAVYGPRLRVAHSLS